MKRVISTMAPVSKSSIPNDLSILGNSPRRLNCRDLPFDEPKLAIEHGLDFAYLGAVCVPVDRTTSNPMAQNWKAAKPETITIDHMKDIWDIELVPKDHNIALKCGVDTGLFVLSIGADRGDFVPNLKPGKYGVRHTALGNLFCKTKRILTPSGGVNLIFGIYRHEWPDGLHSSQLIQPDIQGRGSIDVLADNSFALIEPSADPRTGRQYRFFTPLYHEDSLDRSTSRRQRSACAAVVNPLYELGIMTLHREEVVELLHAFNPDWANGPVYANRYSVRRPKVTKCKDEYYDIQALIELANTENDFRGV
jgi:hypothetical protein